MALDQRFLDEVKNRLTLSDQIGRVVKLTRAGREFKACCPFHKEKTPSFYINDDKGFYHCFGCGAHGGVFDFRMRYHGDAFPEAVKALADEAGVQMPEPPQRSPQARAEAEKRATREQQAYQLLDFVAQWFTAQLFEPQNAFVRDYLSRRGVAEDSLHAFRLGYAPNDWNALHDALRDVGHDIGLAAELGVLKRSERGKEPYAFFRGRLMFPVLDRRGRVIAFGGRHMDEAFTEADLGDFTPAKYMNSPDHILFHKGQNVYNQARARGSRSTSPVVLVEGYMDVIAMVQAGFDRAVAPLGTAVTEQQLELLWRLAARVPQAQTTHQSGVSLAMPLVCLDGDAAGQRAAERVVSRALPLLKTGKTLGFVFMPEGQDPDDVLRHKGAQELGRLLVQTTSLHDMMWQSQLGRYDTATPDGRAQLEQELQQMVGQIADPTLQRFYREEFRQKIWALGRQSGRRGGNSQWNKSQSGGTYARDGQKSGSAGVMPHPTLLRPDDAELMAAKIALVALARYPVELCDNPRLLALIATCFPDAREWVQEVTYLAETVPAAQRETELGDELRECHEKHLSNEGLRAMLSQLCAEQIDGQAPYIREGTEVWDVRRGLELLTNQLERHAMIRDLNQLRVHLQAHPSEEGLQRLVALQESLAHVSDDDDAALA